jgi:predicted nuclease with TOPRIM domain
MKKAMSKIAQINKEELSAQKVELANVKSFKSKVDKLDNEFSSTLKRNISINDDLKKNISDFKQLQDTYSKMEAEVDSIKKAFNELGVEIDANTDLYLSKVDLRQRAIKKILSNSIKGQQAFK